MRMCDVNAGALRPEEESDPLELELRMVVKPSDLCAGN